MELHPFIRLTVWVDIAVYLLHIDQSEIGKMTPSDIFSPADSSNGLCAAKTGTYTFVK